MRRLVARHPESDERERSRDLFSPVYVREPAEGPGAQEAPRVNVRQDAQAGGSLCVHRCTHHGAWASAQNAWEPLVLLIGGSAVRAAQRSDSGTSVWSIPWTS